MAAQDNKAKLVDVLGTAFASGLFWQPLSGSSGGERNKETKRLARELRYELFVLRTGSFCVGFSKAGDIKAQTPSLAVAISKSIELKFKENEFIFIDRADSGEWIYVAQSQGVILPEGDRWFASEDEARLQLINDLSISEWRLIVAPALWGISGSQQVSLHDLLPQHKNKLKVHKWWRLQAIERSHAFLQSKLLWLLIAALVFAGSAIGYKHYRDKKIAEEKARMEAIRRAELAGQIVHPWKELPLATNLFEACQVALGQIKLFPGNWTLSNLNCTPNGVTVLWQPNQYGWIEHLHAVVPKAVISPDGKNASLSQPIENLKTGFDEALVLENDRLSVMYAAAQRYGVSLTTQPSKVPQIAPPPEAGDTPMPTPSWVEFDWSADKVLIPEAVLTALDGPGFRIKNMSAVWQSGQLIWKIEGTQYVEP